MYSSPGSGLLVTKKGKQFVDISLSSFGSPNPLNGDLTTIKNEVAINNAIKNIVMFIPSEVPFNHDIGSNTTAYLFDLVDEVTAGLLAEEIRRAIEFCEPRVTFNPVNRQLSNGYDAPSYRETDTNLSFGETPTTSYDRFGNAVDIKTVGEQNELGVFVVANPEQNEFNVTIIYRIIGGQEIFRVQQLLTPTR